MFFGVLFADCSHICSHFFAQHLLGFAQSRPEKLRQLEFSAIPRLQGEGSVLRRKIESLRLLDEIERRRQCLGIGGVVGHARNVEEFGFKAFRGEAAIEDIQDISVTEIS